jgi:uncharacterized protein YktB (UPF0637 family)
MAQRPPQGFSGFRPEDFQVFQVPDFAGRMQALRTYLRPRLVDLAQNLAPTLAQAAGVNLYAHVAAHLRRRVHPPEETWAAFGPSPRSYKDAAHYALGVTAQGIWLRLVLKDEAGEDRRALAHLLQRRRQGERAWSLPDLLEVKSEGEPPLSWQAWEEAGHPGWERLLRRQGAQWSVGRSFPRHDGRLSRLSSLEDLAAQGLAEVLPLWRCLPSWPERPSS